MSEKIKTWLNAMYEENIENAKVKIENIKIWVKDSNSKEEEQMYLDNIAIIQDYIAVLEELRENVETM